MQIPVPHQRAKQEIQRDKIVFYPEQIKYLKEQFPNVVLPVTATEAQMHRYFGQQSVIAFISTLPSNV